ncbi:glutamine synthetase family protein [Nocardia pseudovaccinii]|uniref:glutamine synthetase family protein n=1 Tax=Nocardia pseudovaccinii TaxID=189540 RepID=UPI003D8A0355
MTEAIDKEVTDVIGFGELPNLRQLYDDFGRVAEISAMHRDLEARGIKHIHFEYVTLQGRVLSKVIPTHLWPEAAHKGLRLGYNVAGGFASGLNGQVFGEGGETGVEGVMVPDLSTLAVLPWDPEFARVRCWHYRLLEDADRAGEPVLTDTRHLLALALSRLERQTGIKAVSGCEPEMSWFRDIKELGSRSALLPENVNPAYHFGHTEDMRPVLKKVTEYATAMGLEMIQAAYEDFGQLECNFQHDDFLLTADRLVTYRQICVQVARELGYIATFMPKPAAGILGNGCHHNVSFWRDGQNILIDPAVSGRENLTPEGLAAVGGLLTHAPALMALFAPTVNSYKRYANAAWSPDTANWGYDNRRCAIRVLPGRLEVRLPDAVANPYLSHLGLLQAVVTGWATKADPGPPQTGLQPVSDAERPVFGALPRTLGDALSVFQADEVISGALPQELRQVFVDCKTDEWNRYCAAITDWDLANYLNYLP